jgi:hypothetical protein
LFVQW